MSQVYMTAKLNLADGTILYPQVSLDNIVASISDPTLVSVATTTNGKVPVTELPVVTVVGAQGSNNNIPTEAAVRALADTKQNTLVAGTGTEIINGSTINAMAVNLNDVVVNNVPSASGLYLEVEGNTMSVVGQIAGATVGVPGTVMGATNGVTLDGGVVTGLFGDGIEVVGNTAKVDIATVAETLNGTAGSNMVDADGLRGAMSLGQAVDVSSKALYGNLRLTEDYDYLGTFTIGMTDAATNQNYYFGFNGSAGFPKFAANLKYLYIVDVRNSGSVDTLVDWRDDNVELVPAVAGVPNSLGAISPDTATDPEDYTWQRMACLATTDQVRIRARQSTGSTQAIMLDIKNWRQYEVTNLTSEAISELAKQDDPDDWFRSSDFFAISGRYMIKADMVNPWTFLISMPTNTPAMTIGSGLAYQVFFTDGEAHELTVDTFPKNAYGADSHVQLLLANGSSVVFNSPLNLIDPIITNAANNITVKFRAGQANVYVDDTDVGYIVTVAGDTTGAGSLVYGLTSTADNFIMFDVNTDEQPISIGTDGITYPITVGGSSVYLKSVVGNGQDKTLLKDFSCVIDSTYSASGNKAIFDMRGVTIDGFTGCLKGYGTLQDCRFVNCVGDITQHTLVWKNASNCVFDNCEESGWGLVTMHDYWSYNITGCTFSNSILHDPDPVTHRGEFIFVYQNRSAAGATIQDCLFVDNYAPSDGVIHVYRNCAAVVKGTTISGGGRTVYLEPGSTVSNITKATLDSCVFPTTTDTIYVVGGNMTTSGPAYVFVKNSILLNNRITVGTAPAGSNIWFVEGCTIDLTGNTNAIVVSNYGTGSSATTLYTSTIKVVDVADTTASISGTATVLYDGALDGEPGIVKSRTISGGGTGYIMRNNGSIGKPVTVGTGTGAGTLYDEFTNGTATEITFAPTLDGTTVSIGAEITESPSVVHNINGAGIGKTIIGGEKIRIWDTTYGRFTISNCTIKSVILIPVSYPNAVNCEFTGITDWAYLWNTSQTGKGLFYDITNCSVHDMEAASWGAISVSHKIENCKFYNITGTNKRSVYFLGSITLSGSTFSNTRPIQMGMGVASQSHTISDCIFDNTAEGLIYATSSASSVSISGCTFATSVDGLDIYNCQVTFSGTNVMNGTVKSTNGTTGTVAFADGATVTGTADNHCIITGTTSGGTITRIEIAASPATGSTETPKEREVNLKYVDIEGATVTNGAVFRSGTYENCTFTDCHATVSSGSFFTASSGSTFVFKNCSFTRVYGTIKHAMYLAAGETTMESCTFSPATSYSSIYMYNGLLTISGTMQIGDISKVVTAETGTVRILDGTVLKLNTAIVVNNIQIGKLSSSGVWTPGGTITVTKWDDSDSHTVTGSTGSTLGWVSGTWTSDIA